ncbi:MAG: LUD domain-containing protein [Candidatus Levyibacteriota bacterium]
MKQWDQLAIDESIEKTITSLTANGITALVVDSVQDAKEKVFSLVPEGAEVMTMASITLETIGITKEINESGKYNSVKNALMKMDRKTQSLQMQKLGAAPEYAIGSVHAVTEDGKILIASNTGSQLPAYAYASAHVIWVVGTQKITTNLDEATKRVYDYVLPLESEHMKQLYKVPGSNVSKLLLITKELVPGRLTMIFVKEKLGF